MPNGSSIKNLMLLGCCLFYVKVEVTIIYPIVINKAKVGVAQAETRGTRLACPPLRFLHIYLGLLKPVGIENGINAAETSQSFRLLTLRQVIRGDTIAIS